MEFCRDCISSWTEFIIDCLCDGVIDEELVDEDVDELPEDPDEVVPLPELLEEEVEPVCPLDLVRLTLISARGLPNTIVAPYVVYPGALTAI